MGNKSVSISVVRRLPRYYRFLGELLNHSVQRISSRELSQRMGLTASQIRQDLNCFGGFGQQGYGYNVELLHREIGNILGMNQHKKTILIGVGNLGRAILSHMAFEEKGIEIIGLFDRSEALVGEKIGGLTIAHTDELEAFCRERQPKVAILCVPKYTAEDLVVRLCKLGVNAYWNFSHYDIAVHHPGTVVENVHLGDSLMTLCYEVKEMEEPSAPQGGKKE
ncbi:MAG: redox-sensing transcriptional repressor Rex [Oscillospiraceae bacterium]|nr:redox-sensing transcriptional repressor Rex [Oscillospiraceae bacterium]